MFDGQVFAECLMVNKALNQTHIIMFHRNQNTIQSTKLNFLMLVDTLNWTDANIAIITSWERIFKN